MTGLGQLPATFTTAVALAAGVHPRTLYQWRDRGDVLELSRGVFRRSDSPEASQPDLLAIAHRAPMAVVCLISAAALHDLTDELPPAVQIAIPRGKRRPQISYPPIDVFHFDAATFDVGRSEVSAAQNETVRVYSAARTVVDLMRFRRSLGDAIAFGALRRYMRQRGARPALLLNYARQLDVLGPVRSAVDVLQAS